MKPVLIFPIADPHVGSIYGLHPNYVKRGTEWVGLDEAGGWFYKNREEGYYLNSKQLRIWKHTETAIKTAARLRAIKDCDLMIIVMGDAIDGDHHQTHQITTRNESEQMKAHVEFMKWTFDQFSFQYGRDKLVYIEGTESHTRDNEEVIAQWLSAEKFGKFSCVPFLETEIQGNVFWFFHHGMSAGYSYNKGSGLYNYLKRIYVDRKMNDKRPPNVIVTADKHDPDYQTYRHNGNELHGVICPPLQDKTRFGNKLPNVIVHESKLGFSPILVEDGKVNVLPSYIFEMPLNEVLVW